MSPQVTSHVDTAERTAVVTTEFDQPIAVVWTLWSDPAKLAQWWGPPGMPMIVHRHQLQPGDVTEFTVELPDGAIRGQWAIHTVDPPRALTFTFSSDGLEPTDIAVQLIETSATSTTLHMTLQFTSDEIMRHALDIGFIDGVARSVDAAHTVAKRC